MSSVQVTKLWYLVLNTYLANCSTERVINWIPVTLHNYNFFNYCQDLNQRLHESDRARSNSANQLSYSSVRLLVRY